MANAYRQTLQRSRKLFSLFNSEEPRSNGGKMSKRIEWLKGPERYLWWYQEVPGEWGPSCGSSPRSGWVDTYWPWG